MVDLAPRWLNSEQTASYVGRRVDELPRLVRAEKPPTPSLHFGPRSPRWDRIQLDSLFLAEQPSRDLDLDAVEQEAVNGIIERARRAKALGLMGRSRNTVTPAIAEGIEDRARKHRCADQCL